MATESSRYETTIGLEIHVQLATASKLFCGDSIAVGAESNTHISAISLAHPGTLPRINRRAVELAVKMGLACNCSIAPYNFFARKNYFYPDLPKGFQVSQHTVPVCNGGMVDIIVNETTSSVQLNRIHLEEDAGKSIHDADERFTNIDHNRAGTPLIEIVTEPCIHSADEAAAYVNAIRKLVRWLDVSDGNMERGNLRCDANISISKKGATELGTKVEVKNLNSVRNLKKAIEYEVERMSRLLDEGKRVIQQTRSFDATNDTTFALRDKEEANDYRYFPDPDLAPFVLTDDDISNIRSSMPPLPAVMVAAFKENYGLNHYDATQLTEDKAIAALYETIISYIPQYKAVANWVNGPVKQWLNEKEAAADSLLPSAHLLGELIKLVEQGAIGYSAAIGKVFPVMIESGKTPSQLIAEMNLQQVSDSSELEGWVAAVLQKMPDKVAEYKKGKKGLIGLFVGEVKKLSKGKADLKLVTELMEQQLKS